jgi:uncharacterized phage protein (predicted DNA packaging)
MEYLTLEYIKKHSRIDFDCEDDLLELYGNSAENAMAQVLNRGKDATEMVASLTEDFGKVPDPIMHATLELVDASYLHRSPADAQQMYYVLYGFDFKVKPYMKL